MRRATGLAAAAFLAIALAACSAAELSTSDERSIYSAVIRDQVAGRLSVLEGAHVYLVDSAADQGGMQLGPELREGIIESLEGLPCEFSWLDGGSDVPWNDATGGRVAAIWVGEIETIDGDVEVLSSAIIGGNDAEADFYLLEKADPGWQVIQVNEASVK